MGRPKTYIIRLSEEERATLRKIIRNKKTCKTVLKRCQILLELDEEQGRGLTHTQLAHSYAVCPGTITNIVQSYVKNGTTETIRRTLKKRTALPVSIGTSLLSIPDLSSCLFAPSSLESLFS